MPTKYTLFAAGRWQPWQPVYSGLEWPALLDKVWWYRRYAPEHGLFVTVDGEIPRDVWQDFPGQRMARYPITLSGRLKA